jgi:hypothetical protein
VEIIHNFKVILNLNRAQGLMRKAAGAGDIYFINALLIIKLFLNRYNDRTELG